MTRPGYVLAVRQLTLAAVVIMALSEGMNGRVLGTYFVAALLLAGVDLAEVKDLL